MNPSDLTRNERWTIADRLAEERLPAINERLIDVVPSRTWYSRYGKRALDIVVSSLALLATLPLNAVIGTATLLDVGRPLFFRQERVGRNGKLFTLVKFRNMRDTRDRNGDLLPASQRVTGFGRFVRKTSLDELLNFWSILKGDMSVIGPRPLLPEYTHRLNKRHVARLSVRPGLECPPREATDSWTWQDQFENDVWYVENVSFKTDCKMVGNLVRYAFSPKSSKERGSATRGIFMGYDLDGRAITLEEVPKEYMEGCRE